MNDIASYVVVAIAGLALGVFYWLGLWWTCRRTIAGAASGSLIALSYFVRLGVMLGTMYILGRDSLIKLAIILLAMLAVRFAVSRQLTALQDSQAPQLSTGKNDDSGHNS